MTTELIDFRGKLTPLTDKFLDIESKVTGKDRSEIVRELLHGLALEHVDNFNLRHKEYIAKGLLRESQGK